MLRRYGTGFRSLLMIADLIVTILSALVLSRLLFDGGEADVWAVALPSPGPVLVVYAIAWVAVLWSQGLYRPRARWSLRGEAAAALWSTVVMFLGTSTALYLGKLPDVSRLFLFLLLASQFGSALISRGILRAIATRLRRQGRNLRNVLVIGTEAEGRDFAARLEHRRELGLRVIGFLGEPAVALPFGEYLGTVDRLAAILHERVVDEVAICLSPSKWLLLDELLATCESEGKIVRMPMILPAATMSTGSIETLDGLPVLSVLTRPHAIAGMSLKRFVDVTASGAALIALAPLFLGLSIAILVTSGRPIFFGQERVGLHGRAFRMIKFRSMQRDAEARKADLLASNEIDGFAFKVTNDPRITEFGRWLRRSSLDELPQLWNVLRGEMSLVGPRPPLPSEVLDYHPWHRRRLSMKPGITGLWQIEGRREPSFDQWVRKDLEYIDRWSPLLDLEILLRTIPAVLRAEGR